jgi:hypothetical protein
MKMDEDYIGHKIILKPGQHDNNRWTCQFVIVKFGQTDMEKRSGYPEGSFGSRQEAEAAALAAAKAVVDTNSH